MPPPRGWARRTMILQFPLPSLSFPLRDSVPLLDPHDGCLTAAEVSLHTAAATGSEQRGKTLYFDEVISARRRGARKEGRKPPCPQPCATITVQPRRGFRSQRRKPAEPTVPAVNSPRADGPPQDFSYPRILSVSLPLPIKGITQFQAENLPHGRSASLRLPLRGPIPSRSRKERREPRGC
jgi:hypothetical protein